MKNIVIHNPSMMAIAILLICNSCSEEVPPQGCINKDVNVIFYACDSGNCYSWPDCNPPELIAELQAWSLLYCDPYDYSRILNINLSPSENLSFVFLIIYSAACQNPILDAGVTVSYPFTTQIGLDKFTQYDDRIDEYIFGTRIKVAASRTWYRIESDISVPENPEPGDYNIELFYTIEGGTTKTFKIYYSIRV